MSTNFAEEFRLYEDLFCNENKEKLLSESFDVYCPSCKKITSISAEQDFMCPNCSSEYLLDNYIEESVLDLNSPWILIYNKNGIIGKSNIESKINPLGVTTIAHVKKEFFDQIKPMTKHKITSENSDLGGFRLEDLDKTTATIVKRALELSETNKERED